MLGDPCFDAADAILRRGGLGDDGLERRKVGGEGSRKVIGAGGGRAVFDGIGCGEGDGLGDSKRTTARGNGLGGPSISCGHGGPPPR